MDELEQLKSKVEELEKKLKTSEFFKNGLSVSNPT